MLSKHETEPVSASAYDRVVPSSLPSRASLRRSWRLHKLVWGLSGGRIGSRVRGVDVLELVTTGHKSGEARSVLLFYLPADAGWLVSGSNSGASYDPAWVKNLRAKPEASVVVGGKRFDVIARFTDGDERSETYRRFVEAYDDYATYEQVTDRTIAVVHLEPVEPS